MSADPRPGARWLVPVLLIVAACAARPTPSSLPGAPAPPEGWTSIGSIGGEASPGRTAIRLPFSGRAVALNATCTGTGTLFVIVDRAEVSPNDGPRELNVAAFPCRTPIEGPTASRLELASAPTGDAEVNAFVLEGAGSTERARFVVSVEEQAPAP